MVADQFPGGFGRSGRVQTERVGGSGGGGEALASQLFSGFGIGTQPAGAAEADSAQRGQLSVGDLADGQSIPLSRMTIRPSDGGV